MDWLREGDRNTALFQAKSKERARGNQIRSLTSSEGLVITKQEYSEQCAVSFYQELFTGQQDQYLNGILQYVQTKVTDINTSLCRLFTAEEVEKALFMMGPNKAPGPDGQLDFFRHIGIYRDQV